MSRALNHLAYVNAIRDHIVGLSRASNVVADVDGALPDAANWHIVAEARKVAKDCGISPAPKQLIETLCGNPDVMADGLRSYIRELEGQKADYELSAAGM